MGRKGRGKAAKATVPNVCFYCVREFQDVATLVAHQQVSFWCVRLSHEASGWVTVLASPFVSPHPARWHFARPRP